MKRLAIIRGGAAMALMLGTVVVVAASAEASPSGQLGVYVHEGLSLKRAQVALATQSRVEAAELPQRLEKALGASFAGMWFEPSKGKLCVGVVSSASRRTAERVVAQTGLAGVVSYVSVRSTWAQLISAQGEWNAKLAHLGRRQFSTGLTANNTVSVTLSSSVPEHQRALLEREAARSHVNVSIAVVPPEALVLSDNNSKCEFKTGEAYCSKPIAAGVLISNLSAYCTAGPLAILSNPTTLAAELETLLITAGHCTATATKWFTSTHPAPRETKEIGSVVFSLNDLGGDYGDILVSTNWLEAGVTPALAQITNYQDNGLREARNILGEAVGMPGTTFCHQGATSGEQCGKVTAVNQSVVSSGVRKDGLVQTNACSESGDSGGPYATLPGNSVDILGTHVAGLEGQTCSVLFCTGCLAYYEPIKTSLEGLKLTLLTTANQTRHRGPGIFLTKPGGVTYPQGFLSHSNKVSILRSLNAAGTAVEKEVKCETLLNHGTLNSPTDALVELLFHKCTTTDVFTVNCQSQGQPEGLIRALLLALPVWLNAAKTLPGLLFEKHPGLSENIITEYECGGVVKIQVRGTALWHIASPAVGVSSPLMLLNLETKNSGLEQRFDKVEEGSILDKLESNENGGAFVPATLEVLEDDLHFETTGVEAEIK